jgi:hypothetical protein
VRGESGEEAEFFAELHRLRPSPGPQFVENAAGMGLDRVFAHKKLFGNLAVAQALGYQFKNLKLAAGDMEILSFSFVGDEPFPGGGRHLPHNNCLPFSGQLEAKPDAKNGKGRRDQATVDFDRMFNYQKPIFCPPERGNQNPTDQPVQHDVALHEFMYDYHWNYRTLAG